MSEDKAFEPKFVKLTHPKPAPDAPAAEWEQYVQGILPPDANASEEAWNEWYKLTEEAADQSPDKAFQGRTPNVHADLLGGGTKASNG